MLMIQLAQVTVFPAQACDEIGEKKDNFSAEE